MIEYITLDVFTDKQYDGNPLAVIPDARGIDDEAMKKIAREFNYSEITFVLPPKDPKNTALVRIFTPKTEYRFAGHPNVGTAYALGKLGEVFGKKIDDKMLFEEKAGIVEANLESRNGEIVGAKIAVPEILKTFSFVEPELIAKCLNIDPKQIVTENHGPQIASVGLEFALVELDSLESLRAISRNDDAYKTAIRLFGTDAFRIYAYVRTGEGRHKIEKVRARMINQDHEDPGTGSAGAALAAYLSEVYAVHPSSGIGYVSSIEITQGIEVERPNLITPEVTMSGGQATRVILAGKCADVGGGYLRHGPDDNIFARFKSRPSASPA